MNLNYSVWVYIDITDEKPVMYTSTSDPSLLGEKVIIVKVIDMSSFLDEIYKKINERAASNIEDAEARNRLLSEYVIRMQERKDEAGN